jgi:hypothetical protein
MKTRNMKKIVYTLLCLLMANFAVGQTDYSDYLKQAREKAEAGDCEGAQRFYNVYVEMTGETDAVVNNAIQQCYENNSMKEPRKYKVGEDVGEGFKIAYVDDTGRRGFAIRFSNYYECIVPDITINELQCLYPNRRVLNLSGEYWSTSKASAGRYYTFDFTTGETRKRRLCAGRKLKYLNIFRFNLKNK